MMEAGKEFRRRGERLQDLNYTLYLIRELLVSPTPRNHPNLAQPPIGDDIVSIMAEYSQVFAAMVEDLGRLGVHCQELNSMRDRLALQLQSFKQQLEDQLY